MDSDDSIPIGDKILFLLFKIKFIFILILNIICICVTPGLFQNSDVTEFVGIL